MKSSRFTILLLVLGSVVGCGAERPFWLSAPVKKGFPIAPEHGGIYTGPECAPYVTMKGNEYAVLDSDYHGYKFFSGNRQRSMTAAAGATFSVCINSAGLEHEQYEALFADHAAFDDRRFDHLRAASMVLDCARNRYCEPQIAAMMAGYARRIDPKAVDTAFAAAGASAPLRQALLARLQWARQGIELRVSLIPPRLRELWVDVPERVWAERQEYYTRFATLYAELDPLLAEVERGSGDLAATAAKLRALRGRYLDACKAEGCLFTPFVVETTRALLTVAVRKRDVAVAFAEADLLDDDRMHAQLLSRAILTALMPATERARTEWTRYDEAKRKGTDDVSLRAMFGDVPPVEVRGSPWSLWGKGQLPDLTAALAGTPVDRGGGNVRAVQLRGGVAIVTFADDVTTYEDADCRETSKIDGISSDGKLIYRQVCTNFRMKTERKKLAPIEVPPEDAASLRPGDLVLAFVSDRRAAIVHAEREGKLVQVRGNRLRVREAARRAR
jgi:hypothetical protein